MKKIICAALALLCSLMVMKAECLVPDSTSVTNVKIDRKLMGIEIDKSYCKVLSVKQEDGKNVVRLIISFKNKGKTTAVAVADVNLVYADGSAQASPSELLMPSGSSLSRSKIIEIPLEVNEFDVVLELKDVTGKVLETHKFRYPK